MYRDADIIWVWLFYDEPKVIKKQLDNARSEAQSGLKAGGYLPDRKICRFLFERKCPSFEFLR